MNRGAELANAESDRKAISTEIRKMNRQTPTRKQRIEGMIRSMMRRTIYINPEYRNETISTMVSIAAQIIDEIDKLEG